MAKLKTTIQNGFTLLEMLISLTVFSFIFGFIVIFSLDIFGFNSFLTSNMSAQDELQLTLTTMEIELRSMSASGLGSYPIAAASANSLTFFSDIDLDGLSEGVRYFTDGNIFKKGVIKPTGNPMVYDPANEQIEDKVHNVIADPAGVYKYYGAGAKAGDAPMTLPVNPSLIRSIKVYLSSDDNPQTEPLPVSYVIFATIRNLRTAQ